MTDNNPSIALVTGAGSGIGRETARALAAEGFSLVLVGRTLGKLEATAATLPTGIESLLIAGDLADTDFASDCVDRCAARFGRVDALVNAAGVAPLAPIDRTTEDLLEEVFFANTFGPAALIARAWPIFKRQRSGRIVNVSTIGTIDPFPGFFAYAASKSALDSFTRSIAVEGRAIGVRGFSVNPGAVETPLLRANFSERAVPPERALDPGAVARVVVDCAVGRRDEDNGRVIPLSSP